MPQIAAGRAYASHEIAVVAGRSTRQSPTVWGSSAPALLNHDLGLDGAEEQLLLAVLLGHTGHAVRRSACGACQRSQSAWRPIQSSGDILSRRASRSAVSAVMPRLPLMILGPAEDQNLLKSGHERDLHSGPESESVGRRCRSRVRPRHSHHQTQSTCRPIDTRCRPAYPRGDETAEQQAQAVAQARHAGSLPDRSSRRSAGRR
jgi:hypothetical protein